ncbi:primosomal replication protein [Shewanella sp. SR43-4]|jgi:primosomal replication protein N''|uniref:Primosomal replication protein n=1 Tax=Shewanella vesiculosa TaxID=518738 RepID=A0ABV0FU51_9GAMM|nr:MULTISPECIES: primosomal replication protein [Shewanella]NCQ44041.1 prepilin peptidase [Shewanella frigidimarina]MBB1316712.1 primosomal replication protein [Shewanella sp. SR43-4]MBB1320465.1 primosomal replication protein [Shewanella sp. SR43-8]MBB1390719.1 primosomal replication protein [Shewanella sp. SG44-6]MBB1474554.1 primosomal replication protein [Shewanella sp. SG41-3]|tara:strand:+ start:9470 stop:10132 length:663 start_codon:yes stop_codon:yes gene_type:complete
MNTQQLVSMLKQQLAQLEQDALIHDQNLAPSQRQSLIDIERFNSQLFAQQGAQLSPCIIQLRQDIKQLEKQLFLKLGGNVIQLSCNRIQDRFSALRRALLTTDINLKSEQQRKASNRARYAKKQQQAIQDSGFGWIASNVMQNSHQLYAELNKHLNWAKKIEQKIQQMEATLEFCHSNDKIKLQNDILSMHRRLGKCKQATSYIEERIQLFERPRQSYPR